MYGASYLSVFSLSLCVTTDEDIQRTIMTGGGIAFL
jgi:hypothetical protein